MYGVVDDGSRFVCIFKHPGHCCSRNKLQFHDIMWMPIIWWNSQLIVNLSLLLLVAIELTQNDDVELCTVWPDTILGKHLVLAGHITAGVLHSQSRESSVAFNGHIQTGLDLGVIAPPWRLGCRRAKDVDDEYQRLAGFDLLCVFQWLAVLDDRSSCIKIHIMNSFTGFVRTKKTKKWQSCKI